MIPIVKPFLPPQEEYNKYINDIWQRNWLTNNGPLVNELELKLKNYLRLKHLLFVSNGTIAIQLAIKALDLKGEILTTPFSYVATASSIQWESCMPVFVDIDGESLTIDPNKLEDAITPKTTGIVATHVYGNSCYIDDIKTIADKHNLKVIYDAAHSFGVNYKGKSVFEYGDISTTSFHATKLFHTIEGGAVVTKHPDVLKKLAYMRNFGHDGPESFACLGINGKNSEFHAAMGLCNLEFIDEILEKRKALSLYYDEKLRNLDVVKPKLTDPDNFNYAYYPLVFPSEGTLLKAKEQLNRTEIFPRRYFYPTLSSLPYVKKYETPVADDIAKRVLCLPLYHTLSNSEVNFICRLLLRVQNN